MSTRLPLRSDRPAHPWDGFLTDVVTRAVQAGRAFAFWVAVVLPFLYAPLVFSGVDIAAELVVVAGLLGLNVAALLAGHGHLHERAPSDTRG